MIRDRLVEHIAKIWLGRSEDGSYSVLLHIADGAQVQSDGWRTISAALEWTGRQEELLKLATRERIGDPEVP